MKNVSIGYGNLVDAATVTGSGWAGGPVTNVQVRTLATYAESNSATPVINLDHGSAKTVQCVGLFAHTIPSGATVTVKRGTTSGAGDVATLGPITAGSFTPLDGVFDGKHFGIFLVFPTPNSARYTTVEFANGGSSFRLGRVFVGPMFTPDLNPEYGNWKDDWLADYSAVERSDNGADWVSARRRLRSVAFTFPMASLGEASTLHEIMRINGTTGEVMYIPDYDDLAATQQYGFLGMMRQLSALENPWPLKKGVAVVIDERGGAL